jgi:hypothetical protein
VMACHISTSISLRTEPSAVPSSQR